MDDVPADATDGALGTKDDTTRETTYRTICEEGGYKHLSPRCRGDCTHLLIHGVPIAKDCPSSNETRNERVDRSLLLPCCCACTWNAFPLQEEDRLVYGDELCEIEGMLLCRFKDELQPGPQPEWAETHLDFSCIFRCRRDSHSAMARS